MSGPRAILGSQANLSFQARRTALYYLRHRVGYIINSGLSMVFFVSGPPGSRDRIFDKDDEIARSFLLPFLSRDYYLGYIFSSRIGFAADPVEINLVVRYVVLYFDWFLFQQNRSICQVKVNKVPYFARYSLLRFVRKKPSRLLSYVLWVMHATHMTHINHSRVLTSARFQVSDSTSSENTSRKVGS